MNLNSSQNVIVSINVQVQLNLDPINVSINVQFTILNKKKTNFIELKSMFLKHQKEVKLVKIFSTGEIALAVRLQGPCHLNQQLFLYPF